MKKSGRIILIIFLAVAGIAAVVFSVRSEKNKKNSVERNAAESKDSAASASAESDISSENAVTSYEYNGVKYEFSDYELIKDTDMIGQTRYPVKFFYVGEDFDPMSLTEIVDREAIKAESPELKDMWENPDKYSDYEEIITIYERNKPIIEKYTSYEHLECEYLFVKGKVTLLPSDNKKEEDTSEVSLNSDLMIWVANAEDKDLKDVTRLADCIIYFDEPEHTEGVDRAHKYFFITMHYGEEKEFIVGFEVKKQYEKQKIYIGSVDEAIEELGLSINYSKYLVSLDNLHEGIDEEWIKRND